MPPTIAISIPIPSVSGKPMSSNGTQKVLPLLKKTPSTTHQHQPIIRSSVVSEYSPEKAVLRQRILGILDDINNDIMRMYEELKPLETNVDIDMTCYLDPETNEFICAGV
jgi:hypothetical protein